MYRLYPSIYNSFPVIRTTIAKKSPFLRTPAFIFCLSWGRPCGNHAKCCMNEKTIQCLPNPSQHVPIYPQTANAKKSPFSRTAAHIFVSPGNAPGAITLNVVWMERDENAYKLSRCMCLSNYNRFSDRARYWSKIVIFHTPLHSTPPLVFPSEYHHPVWCSKTRIVWLPGGEKMLKISLFVLAKLTNVSDRRTDRHRMPAIAALMHSVARQK